MNDDPAIPVISPTSPPELIGLWALTHIMADACQDHTPGHLFFQGFVAAGRLFSRHPEGMYRIFQHADLMTMDPLVVTGIFESLGKMIDIAVEGDCWVEEGD